MIKQLWKKFSENSDARGKRVYAHILYSALLKIINAIVSFVVVPLYLTYLTEVSFGIWLTVSAVLNWFNFFDLGMGNGLRNKFAEARAKDDDGLAKKYVSTTYVLLAGISSAMLLIFLIFNLFVDWSVIFAAPTELKEEVNLMVAALAILFCPQFVAQLIKMVVTADQRPAVANLMNSIVNVLQLSGLFLLSQFVEPSLFTLAVVMGGINLLIPIIANFVFFSGSYRKFAPSMRHVDMKHAKGLMGLGFSFFILQGAALVVFMTDNLIITQVLGPDEVPAYNIAFRYFNLATVFFGLVTAPFWSAFTDAYVKKEFDWISKMIRRLLYLWGAFALLCVVLYFLAPWVYKIWIGDKLEIPNMLNAIMALWAILTTGLSIFGTFLSGVGKLKISLRHAVLVMIINIPLSIYLAQFSILGSAGVMLASVIGLSLRIWFQPLQTFRILKGTAKGNWNK